MPLPKRIKRLPALSGGVNEVSNLLSVKANEAHSIINMHLNHEGAARTRKGSRLLATFDDPVTGIFDYHKMVGGEPTSELLVVAGFYLYSVEYATGVATQVHTFSTDVKPSIVAFNDGTGTVQVFIANGTDFIKYDGSNVTDATASFPAVGMPRWLMVYDSHLLACGCSTDPYVVWSSNLEDGTTWGVNDYFSQGNQGGDRYIGMGLLGQYCLLFKKFQVEFITEGDPRSSTVKHLVSSRVYGLASHWSYVPRGAQGFFFDESGVYKASLTNVADVIEVVQIHEKVKKTFLQITQFDEISGVYDPNNNEIIWGLQESGNDVPNVGLVLNTALSSYNYQGKWEPVWGGRFEGDAYVPSVFGTYVNASEKVIILRADATGNLFVMDEATQYMDNTTDIISKIYTGAIAPGGISTRCSFRKVVPNVWSRNDGAVNVSWVTDASYQGSDVEFLVWDDAIVSLTGNVPVWNESTQASYLQVWGSTIWAEDAIVPVSLPINIQGVYIEFMIWCDGDSVTADDEWEYSGMELIYQMKGAIR